MSEVPQNSACQMTNSLTTGVRERGVRQQVTSPSSERERERSEAELEGGGVDPSNFLFRGFERHVAHEDRCVDVPPDAHFLCTMMGSGFRVQGSGFRVQG